MLNEYTWEGNNWRIYAHILDVFYPYNTSTHSLALIPLLGLGAENNNFSTYAMPKPKTYAMLMQLTEGNR